MSELIKLAGIALMIGMGGSMVSMVSIFLFRLSQDALNILAGIIVMAVACALVVLPLCLVLLRSRQADMAETMTTIAALSKGRDSSPQFNLPQYPQLDPPTFNHNPVAFTLPNNITLGKEEL